MKILVRPEPVQPPPPPDTRDYSLKLRDYQEEGAAWLAGRGRAYLADDPGLGKTAQALDFLRRVRETATVLIIAPASAHGTWVRESAGWSGRPVNVIKGRLEGRGPRQGIWLTNPEQLHNIVDAKWLLWSAIVVDEAHMFKNRQTKRFRYIRKLKSRYLALLSGSPVVNGVEDLWTGLYLIDKTKFSSYWRFIDEHVETQINWAGFKEFVGPKDPEALYEEIRPYFLRRLKEDVLTELPPKIRQPLYVEMTSYQKRVYEGLAKELIADLSAEGATGGDPDQYLMVGNGLAKMTRLRQTLVNPVLYGGQDSSAAFNTLIEAISLDFDAGHQVIVFCPFASALPLMREAIHRSLGEDVEVSIIRGSVDAETRTAIIDHFQGAKQRNPGVKSVLLCSIGTATSFTATAAKSAYFVGYGFTPKDNIQAEDRIHRIGQDRGVHVKYLVHEGTIDEHILNILDQKTTWSNLALDPHKLLLPFLP